MRYAARRRNGFDFSMSRRDWMRLASIGAVGGSMAGWFEALAGQAAADPRRRRSCILLWMSGGPSQMDTFDLKPGHENGGPVPGIGQRGARDCRICEHLPLLARLGEKHGNRSVDDHARREITAGRR